MRAIFLYDGDCSFCLNLAQYWMKHVDDKLVSFQSFRPLTAEQLRKIHPSLSIEKCESDVQLIYDSRRFSGFFAVRRMMFWSRSYRFLAAFLYLPFIPFFGMLVMYILKRLKTNS